LQVLSQFATTFGSNLTVRLRGRHEGIDFGDQPVIATVDPSVETISRISSMA
jgi:hypothetical protein